MENLMPWIRPVPAVRWRELVMPREHGSWSLAAEPLALGLLLVPTGAGAALAVAVAAAFLARRPLRTAWNEARAERRAEARFAVGGLALLAGLALAAAVSAGGTAWLVWLLPSAIAGGVFLGFDLRSAGREEAAEVAGSAAFACLPAAFAALGGAPALVSVAAAIVMCGRAVPTVLGVRAALRAAKTGARRPLPALIAGSAAVFAACLLARAGAAPWTAVALLGLLLLRAAVLLVYPRPVLRARTIGMIEAVLGAVFAVAVGCAWAV